MEQAGSPGRWAPGLGQWGGLPCDTGEGLRAGWEMRTGWPGKTCDEQLSTLEFLQRQLVCKGRGPPPGSVELS